MKKLSAFFLLSTLMAYHFGFLAVSFLMPKIIHQHWESQIWNLSHETSSGELIRIPFSLPYGQNQENFQAVNLSMEIDGKWKRVIRQRYFDEHLEVIAVPDQLEQKLNRGIHTWMTSFAPDQENQDIPPAQKLLLKSFLKHFIPQNFSLAFATETLPFLASKPLLFQDQLLFRAFEVPLPPPRDLIWT